MAIEVDICVIIVVTGEFLGIEGRAGEELGGGGSDINEGWTINVGNINTGFEEVEEAASDIDDAVLTT